MRRPRSGRRAILYDNLLGSFNSPALAAALTQPTFSDRVLGKSQKADVPTGALFLLTGNNLTLHHDMTRRILVCRIDRQTDAPDGREFDISPAAYCLANRQSMVSAALTLIRYYLTSGAGRVGEGTTESFGEWDAWVRQTILYISREIANGEFGDVRALLRESVANDPERRARRRSRCKR